jgi:hypothetical protein
MNISSTFLFSIPTQDSYLSLSCSLSKKKLPTLEFLIQTLPGLSARFSTMSSGYFLNISFYLSDFEQEGD